MTELNTSLEPTFFASPADFHKWLKKNHQKATELLVGFHKVSSGRPCMTWTQSVDEALCFGWIDGVRRSIDDTSYSIRFTPRKPGSIWSAINSKKVADLAKKGLMEEAGFISFGKRSEDKSGIYPHENEAVKFSAEFEKLFKSNKKAWSFFQSLAPSYRKPATNWIMSAKQESTRIKRLTQLIAESQEGRNRWKDSYRKERKPDPFGKKHNI
jgi:uncharacterized protein YdeI (YjbR/CyaY-like superfamily)